MNKKREYILCAAIYYDDGKTRIHKPSNIETGLVVSAYRHCDCFLLLSELFPNRDYKINAVQGFLTSDKRFVDREEAARIAHKANQIAHYEEGLIIYSEDLY